MSGHRGSFYVIFFFVFTFFLTYLPETQREVTYHRGVRNLGGGPRPRWAETCTGDTPLYRPHHPPAFFFLLFTYLNLNVY